MEEHYTTIARTLHAHCPPGYEKAWIDAEIDDDGVDQGYFCRVDGQDVQPDLPIDAGVTITKALMAIRSTMLASPEAQRWERCTFVLEPSGRFELDIHHG